MFPLPPARFFNDHGLPSDLVTPAHGADESVPPPGEIQISRMASRSKAARGAAGGENGPQAHAAST